MIDVDELITKIEDDKDYTIAEVDVLIDALILYKEMNA